MLCKINGSQKLVVVPSSSDPLLPFSESTHILSLVLVHE